MTQPNDAKSDPRAFACDSIQWGDAIGPGVAVLPGALRGMRASGRFFNCGQRNWPLVAGNGVAAQTGWASASPVDAAAVPGSKPLVQDFSVSARNLYGTSVMTLRYRFAVQSGGRPESDQWIARLTLAASELSIAFGWSVSLSAETQDPCECGDGGAGMAVLPVRIDLVVETKIKQVQESRLYFVSPTGVYSE